MRINKAVQAITFNYPGSKTYGDAAFNLNYTAGASGEPVYFTVVSGPATVTGSTLTITGVGTVTVRASQAGNANYNASADVDQSFTVNRAALTIKADDKSRAYKATDPAFTFTYTGFKNGDNETSLANLPTATTTATNLSVVGTYDIVPSNAVSENYSFTYTKGTLTVTQASQTINLAEVSDKLITDPAFTISATASSGLPVTLSIVSGPASLSGNTITLNGTPGTVTVRATQAGDANYSAALTVTREFVVTDKALATITLSNLNHTYNGAAKAAITTTSPAGLSVNVVYKKNGVVVAAPTAAGTYEVVATVNDAAYQGSKTGTLTIAKAVLTVRAENKTKKYSEPTPAFTVVYEGFQNGETSSVLTTPAVATAAVTDYTSVGQYDITAGGAAADNYTFSYVKGTLTIGKADQTISFAALGNKTFGDAPFLVTASVSSGLPLAYTVTGPAEVYTENGFSNIRITGAGTVTVTASQGGHTNYNAAESVTRSFTVNKATAAIALANLSQTYNGAAKNATATTTPANLLVNFTYVKNGVELPGAPVNAGEYSVVASINHTNYTGTVTGNLVIAKATQTLAFSADVLTARKYGEEFDPMAISSADLSAVYTITAGHEVAEVTAENLIRVKGIGSFTVEASQAGNQNHLAASSVTKVFTVAKTTRAVTFEDQSVTFGNAGYTLTATALPVGTIVYEVVEQESAAYPGKVTIAGNTVTIVKAGKVKLRASVAEDMYGTAASTEMDLTIAKANAAIAISNLEQQYDGQAKQVTVTTTPADLPVTVTYNGSEVLPTAVGTYTVVATVNHENYTGEITATLTIVGTTAIGDEVEKLKMVFYPNPTDKFLYLELEEKATVEIISLVGQVLLKQKANAGETVLDLTNLRTGQYILRVQSKQRQVQKKFIKR